MVHQFRAAAPAKLAGFLLVLSDLVIHISPQAHTVFLCLSYSASLGEVGDRLLKGGCPSPQL